MLKFCAARLGVGLFLLINAVSFASEGYFRFPSIHGDNIVFTAEGDLWQVQASGGSARRLTTHAGYETNAAISPDGQSVAFSAQYEGPTEVYVMPLTGGLPRRLTFEGESAWVRGWTPDGKVLYATRAYSTLPDAQLVSIDPGTGKRTMIPLAQADEGAYSPDLRTLVFTRYSFQGSHAKRYVGGTAQNLWHLETGSPEAKQYFPEYRGVSRWPMWMNGRIYFATERDGTSNLWSMRPDGTDLKQHTHHTDFGLKNPQADAGRIVYQNGADLWLYDSRTDQSTRVPIKLSSDFDQTRETWVTKPQDFITAFALSPDGDRMAMVARGQVFVAPANGQGRLVEVSRRSGVRYRSVTFTPNGESLIVLSDESGEVEFWKLPANNLGKAEQLTHDSQVLRLSGTLSPDGKWLLFAEHDQDLLLYNIETKQTKLIAHSKAQDFDSLDVDWSPDSMWFSFVLSAESGNTQLQLYSIETSTLTAATSDRVNSASPAFSPDGKWLYFLSDRTFNSVVRAPWGPRQPEPFLDKPTKIYALALGEESRSPFQPADELLVGEKKTGKDKPAAIAETDQKSESPKKPAPEKAANDAAKKSTVKVTLSGLMERVWEVPVPAGNYSGLAVNEKTLFIMDSDAAASGPSANRLLAVEIKNKDVETTTILSGVSSYRLSLDGKKLLVQQGDNFAVLDAAAKPASDVAKARVPLSGLRFAYSPRESWRQMFTDAWRLHRDYFYDRNMHGVDWKANLAKHLPLVDRVTDRAELDDVLNYMVSELSALHTDARGGVLRTIDPEIGVASLGIRWTRDESLGGYRIDYIYQTDPEFLERRGPLEKPGLGIKSGDVITEINGDSTLSVPDAAALLRNQAGRQLLLTLKPAAGGEFFRRIVTPVTAAQGADLRYIDWEYTRRLAVDQKSKGQIGYAHIRAMGTANFSEFVRQYYASANKGGLILDLRHNRGGNIDSWMVSRLMRQPWMWWSNRDGEAGPHLQSAFRGHLVVLVDAWTASDGETMANAIRHLKLGDSIGVRTWGGGIWLTGSNFLLDRGLARAAEFGSFIPGEGWVIEGDGFTPDIIIDNEPVRTFHGEDAQLDAAIKRLNELIAKNPKHLIPTPPPYPDKSLKNWQPPKS